MKDKRPNRRFDITAVLRNDDGHDEEFAMGATLYAPSVEEACREAIGRAHSQGCLVSEFVTIFEKETP